MAVLDDPIQYYGPPQEDWALGDIVIAPTAVIWSWDEKPAPRQEYRPPAPPPDGSTSVSQTLWQGGAFTDPVVECWLAPAMIVVDDCVIDKEFNAYIQRRIDEGLSEEMAETEARADTSLDPLIPVVPLLPYGRLRYINEQAVRQGNAVGYFPVPESEDMDQGYVDFTRTVPISRRLLHGPIVSMSEPTRRILRWKLAQFYAVRALSIDAEIMAAVGRTITAVHTVMDSKNRLIVDLELDHGAGQVRLRQEPRRTEVPAGHQRGRS